MRRNRGKLYRGARLAQAWEWAEFSGKAGALNLLEREAQRQREIEAAQKLAEDQRQRAQDQPQAGARLRTRNRIVTAVGVVALVLALAAALSDPFQRVGHRLFHGHRPALRPGFGAGRIIK